jgi:hypothetical protein
VTITGVTIEGVDCIGNLERIQKCKNLANKIAAAGTFKLNTFFSTFQSYQ